jgi:hypothetical protein
MSLRSSRCAARSRPIATFIAPHLAEDEEVTAENELLPATHPLCVPKLTGADAELGNLILGLLREGGTGREASHALLGEVDGTSGTLGSSNPNPAAGYAESPLVGISAAHSYSPYTPATGSTQDPQNIGRKFLASNGGCIYIDLDHLEVCTPEVLSAHEFVAAWHAMLRIVRDAMTAADAKRPPGQRIMVLVNSSDGRGNAYGSHVNFLVTRRLWDDLFVRRLHPDLFVLIAYQVSSVVCTGQGKVGAENGRPDIAYQISQRADFFDQLVGPQTTYNRPIVNSRDEPLCGTVYPRSAASGNGAGLARLHCIFYDSTLCHGSTLLKVGVMQIVLSMLEAGRLDPCLMLEDPLTALVAYSHDPDLAARARLANGRAVTAVELQSMYCERARVHVDAGGCDGLVPGAPAIVDLWEDTLGKLARHDFDGLAPRLDWVLKRAQIERALADRGLDWSAPEAKHLDHLYSSLDLDEGVYWALERAGLTQTLIDDARIEHFRQAPPEDTRAWTRAMLLRQLPRELIRGVDWDRIELVSNRPGEADAVVHLPDPLGHTRRDWCRAGGDDNRIRRQGGATYCRSTEEATKQ